MNLRELDALNLPLDKYAIFGSGPLAIRGIRESNDIDIIVKEDMWKELLTTYTPTSKGNIEIGIVEIYREWPWFENIDELIDTADVIDGHRFVKLDHVIHWKQHMGREKDRRDIELIEKYLKKN